MDCNSTEIDSVFIFNSSSDKPEDETPKYEKISKIIKDSGKDPVLFNNFEIENISQGSLGDCYFLASIVSIAMKDHTKNNNGILHKVMCSTNDAGKPSEIYIFRFFISGIFTDITINEYVPCLRNKLIYASCKDNSI